MKKILHRLLSIFIKEITNVVVRSVRIKQIRPLFLVPFALLISSCNGKMVPAGVTGYNHMSHLSIAIFSVNGAGGSNLNEKSGGGESCCVSIPEHWRPGLKVKVAWQYDQRQDDTSPLPPPQEAIAEIQEYKYSGTMQVHFYENHKIKVIISNCDIEHPFYPLSQDDKLPWLPRFSKKEALEIQKLGGMSNQC